MRSINLVLLGAVAMLAAACASQPREEPAPAPTAPVTETRPAPPAPTPAPTAGPTAGSAAHFVANATDRVYFGYDQHTLTDAARASLQTQAAWLRQYPNAQIQVAGHCDERGTQEYNLALGARRAQAAKDYLVSLGINGSRISTISYGKERPMNPASNEAAWAQNRNAHSVVVSGATS